MSHGLIYRIDLDKKKFEKHRSREQRRIISVLITGRILVFPLRRALIESYSADVINGGLCNVCLILIRAITAII